MTSYLVSYAIVTALFCVLFFLLGIMISKRSAKKRQSYLYKRLHNAELCLQDLLNHQEDERRETGTVIHDQLLQELIYLRVNLDELRPGTDASTQSAISELCIYTDDSIRKTRALAHTMIPFALRELGLVTALHELMQKRQGMVASSLVLTTKLSDERLPASIEIGIYRIIEDICEIHARYELDDLSISVLQNNNQIELGCSIHGFSGAPFDPICSSWIRLLNRIKLILGTLHVDRRTGELAHFQIYVPIIAGSPSSSSADQTNN